MRYAALLHDLDKVGAREEVLVKPRKLPALLLERVRSWSGSGADGRRRRAHGAAARGRVILESAWREL